MSDTRYHSTAARLVELIRHTAVAPVDYKFNPKLDFEEVFHSPDRARHHHCVCAQVRDIDAFTALIKEIQCCNAFALAVVLTNECWRDSQDSGGSE